MSKPRSKHNDGEDRSIKDSAKGLLSRFAKLALSGGSVQQAPINNQASGSPSLNPYANGVQIPTVGNENGRPVASPYGTGSMGQASSPFSSHPASLTPGLGNGGPSPGYHPTMPTPEYYTPSLNPLPIPPVLPSDFDHQSTPSVDTPYYAAYPSHAPLPTSSYVMTMPTPNHYQSESSLAPPPLRHSSSAPDDTKPLTHRAAASESKLPTRPANITIASSDPTTPRRHRANSTPASPITGTPGSSETVVQCSGVTKQNKRCTRQVKAPPPLEWLSPEDHTPRYCFQHAKEMLAPTGFFSRRTREWITFDDWIPSHLTSETKVLLRVEMEKAVSSSDVDGYIYCFELRNPDDKQQVHLKVGRAVNLVKRIDEWTKQCESKEPILRGWYPGPDDGASFSEVSLMRGTVIAGEKGKHCHRLERLIHLELADLSLFSPYLKPGFVHGRPKATSTPSSDSSGDDVGTTPKKKKSPLARKPCDDCGAVHKEIFSFAKVKTGKLKGREWEGIVHPVIERWGDFVETHL